jgi:hypothetical protein
MNDIVTNDDASDEIEMGKLSAKRKARRQQELGGSLSDQEMGEVKSLLASLNISLSPRLLFAVDVDRDDNKKIFRVRLWNRETQRYGAWKTRKGSQS